jgi:hypothetical protein
MKKLIRKYWGIVLVVVLLSTLFIAAAPTSAADPLKWNMQVTAPMYIPGLAYTQYPGSSIVDFAVSADGMTFYVALDVAAGANYKLMKGTMGGAVWTDMTSANNNRLRNTNLYWNSGTPADTSDDISIVQMVSISPDNPDIVVVAGIGPVTGVWQAAASNDGGLNFYDMGTIQDSAAAVPITTAYDLDVSPVSTGNVYYVAIAGTAGANTPAIYYYNFGAAVGAWHEAVSEFGVSVTPIGAAPTWLAGTAIDNFRAIKFSKQFGSDFTLAAVSEEVGAVAGAGVMRLHMLSMASHKWDDQLPLAGYPITVDDGTEAAASFAVQSAGLDMGPDFMGIEEETIITFIGASILVDGATEDGGIYRIDETGTVTVIRTTAINSITFDGTTLVAGAYDTNNVWRTLDVTVNQPTAASARTLKRIGIDGVGNDMVIVAFAGDTLFGAKSADASALSKSTDYGNTWNDFTLMDSSNTVIDDIMFSPDGSTWYMSANDWDGVATGEASVYRISATGTARVLCVDMSLATVPGAGPMFMLRGIPDDPDVVYAGDKSGTGVGGSVDIYVTADGGLTRWSRKTTYPGAIISDMCVESTTVVYGATGVLIFKSTNSGSLWNSGVDTAVSGGVFNLICLGDGKLIAAGGGVVFSTDGGATWTPTLFTAEMGTTLYVAATGLSPTDYIFAASSASANVYRAPAVFFGEFKTMNVPAIPTPAGGIADPGAVNTGIAYVDGILYVMQSYEDGDVADKLGPATPDPASWDATYIIHTMSPTAPVHTQNMWGTRYPTDYNAAYNLALQSMTTTPGSAMKVVSTGTSYKLFGIDTGGQMALDLTVPPDGVYDLWLPSPAVYYFEDIVSPPAAAPVLIGPADGTLYDIVSEMLADAEQVVFTWTRANPQITGYTLWVALDANFTELFFTAAIGSTTPSDTVTAIYGRGTFNPGLTYYWKVNANTPFNGGFSETRSFTVAPSAAIVPTIGSPINGAMDVSETPAFSWSAVSGTTMYEFQLSEGTAFAVPMVSEQVATTAIVPNVTLTAGKTYFWRVRALEPVESDWSSIGSFTVAVPAEPAPPPITVTTTPPPQITVTTPAPPPALTYTPPVEEKIAPAYIWAIIIIGAVLVIAVIVLIVRTRRSV